MMDSLCYFLFQPVQKHINKDHGVCCSGCGGGAFKKICFVLTGKRSTFSGSSGFPLSPSEWSFTIYPMPYNHK